MRFKVPTNGDELLQLQSDTTKLLQVHKEQLQQRRLRAIGLDPELVTVGRRSQMAGDPAENTAAAYIRRGRGLYKHAIAEGLDVWTLAQDRASTAGSWYAARAAVQHYLMTQIRNAKQAIDRWGRMKATAGAVVDADALEKLKKIEGFYWNARKHLPGMANALEAMPTDGGVPGKFKQAGKGKRRRSSKAASLRGLPADWQMKIHDLLPADLQAPWVAACLTGCRPAELKNGVTLFLGYDGLVVATVTGAKVRGHAGQPKREITIEVPPEMSRAVLKLLKPGQRIGPINLGRSVDAYRKVIARVGKQIWPNRSALTRPTAYSARHAFKVAAVAAGVDPVTLANALGHCTTKSSTNYGGGGGGSGGPVLLKATATRQVKIRAAYSPRATKTTKVPRTARKP